MSYKKLAEAVLEERAALVESERAITSDNTLSDVEKRERIDKISTDIANLEADARSFIERAERETETRDLMERKGFALNGSGAQYRGGEWLASEVRSITGASAAGAAFTPAENSKDFFNLLAPKSVFLASGVNVLNTDADSLVIPRLTADPASAFVAEGANITLTDPNGDTVTAVPRKVAVLTAITNEVLADSAPSILEVHAQSILRSAALRFDLGAFEGTGTAPQIRGLKNIAGIGSVSMGTNGAALTNLDPIADALGTLDTANADSESAVIVMHPRTWTAAMKLKEISGSNKALLQESYSSGSAGIERRLLGRRVFLTTQLSVTETQGSSNAASSIYVYDPAQLYAVIRKTADVFLDPYSLTASDQTQVRLTMRADVVAANPAGVVRVAGVL